MYDYKKNAKMQENLGATSQNLDQDVGTSEENTRHEWLKSSKILQLVKGKEGHMPKKAKKRSLEKWNRIWVLQNLYRKQRYWSSWLNTNVYPSSLNVQLCMPTHSHRL